jgi:hypothetical protein
MKMSFKVLNILLIYRFWFLFDFEFVQLKAGGRNVDDQNVDRPKISERQNGLFSWSERRKSKNHFW